MVSLQWHHRHACSSLNNSGPFLGSPTQHRNLIQKEPKRDSNLGNHPYPHINLAHHPASCLLSSPERSSSLSQAILFLDELRLKCQKAFLRVTRAEHGYIAWNPKPLNPKPLNPKPLNPKPLNPKPLNPKAFRLPLLCKSRFSVDPSGPRPSRPQRPKMPNFRFGTSHRILPKRAGDPSRNPKKIISLQLRLNIGPCCSIRPGLQSFFMLAAVFQGVGNFIG